MAVGRCGQKSGLTVSDTGDDVDGAKAAGLVGVNTAVSVCVPLASVEVLRKTGSVDHIGHRVRRRPAKGRGVGRGEHRGQRVTVAVSVSTVPEAAGEAGITASVVVVASLTAR